jgi:Tfp pilus assembly protein PilV
MRNMLKNVNARNGEQGFTILEALVAVAILTFGLLAVGAMQISSIRGNYLGGNTSIALSLASEKMQGLLNESYTDPDCADTTTTNNAALNSITTCDHQENINQSGQPAYRRIWNVADSTSPTLKTITVIVTWQNNRHRVSVSCLKQQ